MLPALGHYNALNALAALAVAAEAGVSDDAIRAGLAGFSGVKRRFTHVGEWRACTSMTITRTIRSRSPLCSAPPASPAMAASSP